MLMDYVWSQNRAMIPGHNVGSDSGSSDNNEDENLFLATLIIYTFQVYR
jgi:hypothetical protein